MRLGNETFNGGDFNDGHEFTEARFTCRKQTSIVVVEVNVTQHLFASYQLSHINDVRAHFAHFFGLYLLIGRHQVY